ncbi:MAG: nucleoside deaminase [Bacteroidales bacterium]
MESDFVKFMREALKEAKKGEERGEIPVGAVVVIGGRVVARGHNMVESLTDPTAHAEMLAITAATNSIGGKYLESATLYVTLEPCTMCASAIGWAQIGRVVYGASDPKKGFTLFSPSMVHPKCEVVGGVLKEECSLLITNFFKNLR